MTAVSTSTTLHQLLKLALPIGSRLLTGSLDAPVSWVCSMRTRPPIFADMEGGELVLVSTSTLANFQKPLTLDMIVAELIELRAGALAVCGPIPPAAHQLAKQHNFPLLTLPERTALPQVERAVQRLLTNREAQLAQRAFELEQTLQRHAASYRGLTTMLNALARMLDRPVVIHSRKGQVISRGLPASTTGHEWDSHLALAGGAEFVRRFDLQDRAFFEDDWQMIRSPAGLTIPLIHESQLLGYLSVLSAGSPPDDFDQMALEYSERLFVRELVRQQANETPTVEASPSRDWISDWLSSPASDDALLTLRAEKDCFRSGMWYAVVLFHWLPANDRIGGSFSPERMVKLLQSEMHQRRIQAPIGQYVDRAVLFFPLDEPQQTQRLKQMVHHLHTVLTAAAPDGKVVAGVGRAVMGLTPLRESFQEAERALSLSEQLWDDSQIAFFGDLSLYELLLGVADPKLLESFCDHWLAPLTRYDEQHNTDLLPTLNAYFNNNGNMARTAHVLNIHRNTLVYRLSRITEIIQLDMDDSNVRLNLHLALKVRRLLETPGAA
jgi:purine catabolism regulator